MLNRVSSLLILGVSGAAQYGVIVVAFPSNFLTITYAIDMSILDGRLLMTAPMPAI